MLEYVPVQRSWRWKKNMGVLPDITFLLTDAILKKHHQKGQLRGYRLSRFENCLFREINRGVEWIFSNNAGELQEIINRLLNK